MTRHPSTTKFLLFVTLLILALSIVMAVISIIPIYPSQSQPALTNARSQYIFTLSPNETYTQDLGALHVGQNVSVLVSVQSSEDFKANFSIMYPLNSYLSTDGNSSYTVLLTSNNTYSCKFNAFGNYYEGVFVSDSPNTGTVKLQVSIQEPRAAFPYSWLTEASKILFLSSLAIALILLLKILLFDPAQVKPDTFRIQPFSEKNRRYLMIILLISLLIWLSLLAINSNPLATFGNWYTDNARDSYVSTLFLKDGFSVFSQPLGKLADVDNSTFKFVTWPQTPHLYPLGSILLFLPFGVFLQQGFNQSLIFKVEVAIFLAFSTVFLYYFLKNFLKKDFAFRSNPKISFYYAVLLKLLAIMIIYYFTMFYAADGEFDSIALIFSLFALLMFMMDRYDYFFLLITVSLFFKYQAGIFLLPLILVGLTRLFRTNRLDSLMRNKAVLGGFFFGSASVFTAFLSLPYFMANNPQLIMSSLNAFSPNLTLPPNSMSWEIQALLIFSTLAGTLAYSVYMLNKNSLLSLSALFLLLPLFLLPYFQDWYLPFFFIYVLIPQRKRELEATLLWLILLTAIIFFSGILL